MRILAAPALVILVVLTGIGLPYTPEADASGEMGPARANEAVPASAAVARTALTSAVVDREPVDQLTGVPSGTERIAFFSEIAGLEGSEIVHRWRRGDEVVAEVPFAIGGPRWRVHSSKALMPGYEGEWTVEVVAEDGAVLARESFQFGSDEPAAPAPVQPAPAAPADSD